MAENKLFLYSNTFSLHLKVTWLYIKEPKREFGDSVREYSSCSFSLSLSIWSGSHFPCVINLHLIRPVKIFRNSREQRTICHSLLSNMIIIESIQNEYESGTDCQHGHCCFRMFKGECSCVAMYMGFKFSFIFVLCILCCKFFSF